MTNNKKKKKWWEYLWILTSLYFILGFFNVLFGWLGMICFLTPLMISIFTGNKSYCHHYCGRGQLLDLLGNKLKLSRYQSMPKWMKHKYFRYGFLIFFLGMFVSMIFNKYLVFQGAQSLRGIITLLWTIKVPWNISDVSIVAPWIAQFAFGFYSMMLTSLIISIITMILYKPKSWCVYCPMGTMTQLICKTKKR
ncbi:4Fe-4S binding protein [Niameybacter massiliensis]|uniref:4Fe-4S binding protein n=1 Tax=Niameybacter massiliensis TaxID=1658108 RepID=UPI0006B53268|nr:4Fe-4S binding protein [Niameybacter massiliensis]